MYDRFPQLSGPRLTANAFALRPRRFVAPRWPAPLER